MNEFTIDSKELEGTGITDAASLIAVIKEAGELKKGASKAEEFKTDVMAELKALTALVNEKQGGKREETEAEEIADLQKESLAKAFASETDLIKKAAIKSELEKHYSTSALEVLEGNEFKNFLMTPVGKNDAKGEYKKEFRQLHDSVITSVALLGGVEKEKLKDRAKMDMNVFNETLDMYKSTGEYDADMIETYRKAAADSWDTVGDTEWIPVNLSRDFVESIWLPLELAPLFKRYQMTSPSFKLPYVGGRPQAGLMAQTTTSADHYTQQALNNQRTSSDITFTAKKLGIQQGYSDEIEQDAIVPTTEIIMSSIRDALGLAIEDAVLNGDVAGFSTLDNASGGNELWTTTAAALGRDAWSGIRKGTQTACKVDSDGVLTAELLRTARKKMGRYSKDPKQMVWVISVNTLMDILNLPEVMTVDKYGPGATILQGEIGRIDGIRIIVSEKVYTNLASTGVYTGTGNTRTAMYLVWLPAWAFGDRKLMRIEQDRSIVAQHNIVVGTMRLDFQDLQGSETTEAWIYDLAA